MKKILLLSLAAFCLTSCWTSILTVAPTAEPVAPPKTVYTTTVTTPTPKHTTVTTVTVTNYNSDPSFYLDLNAVAAAYAESHSVREFEQILNSSRYMINNLDLNRDGWIDYLRVIESRRGYYYTMLIQACLAPGVFQDVATLIAERRANVLYVEVVGDTYLYGYNYIVRPVFVKRPPMWDAYGYSSYAVWASPYYYDYYPSYYTRPKPIYLNHYQAYVNTYMTNHHYCHHCDYPTAVFYTGYTTMTQPDNRHDYQTQHPENSFERRVKTITASSGETTTVHNAGQLRTQVTRMQEDEKRTSTTSSSSRSTTTTNATSASTSNRASSTSTSTTSRSATTSTSTSNRSGSTAKKADTSTRSTSATSSTSKQRVPSTTVETRVNKSGTTRTTVKTTDASGRTSTVKRESSNTRSTSSSSRTSGTTRTSSTTSGSSTRSSQGTTSESSPRSTQRVR